MSYSDEIKKYLMEPTNLEIALEIRDAMLEIPELLEKKFWNDVKIDLSDRLTKKAHGSEEEIKWTVECDNFSNINKNYFGIGLTPKEPPKENKYLYIRLEKENSKLFYGITIGNLPEDGAYNDINDFVTELKKDLVKKGYKEQNTTRIAWKWLDDRTLRDNQILLSISKGDYQRDVAGSLFYFFTSYRSILEDINNKIWNVH